jgi:hypothetical protein
MLTQSLSVFTSAKAAGLSRPDLQRKFATGSFEGDSDHGEHKPEPGPTSHLK